MFKFKKKNRHKEAKQSDKFTDCVPKGGQLFRSNQKKKENTATNERKTK